MKRHFLLIALLVVGCGTESSSDEPSPSAPEEPTVAAPVAKKAPSKKAKVGMTAEEKAAKKKRDKEVCDGVLTADVLKDICGKSITLKPTFVEGMAMNPCNRQGAGLNLLVSRHGSARTAAAGQKVSEPKDKSTETSFAASLRQGNHLVEIRARKGTPCASVDKVTALAKKAAAAY